MSEALMPLAYQLAVGGAGGFIAGYALKKISKLIAILIGFFFLILLYLGYSGIIGINYDKLPEAIRNSLGLGGQALQWFTGIISLLPFAGSFALGFLLGFKLG
ncbi:hypothetical protein KAU92_00215 [Candidatus Bathyarchaeota archaeon]|nr:hypothetical protein [Candidatus Bathyarchaeota archaeon]